MHLVKTHYYNTYWYRFTVEPCKHYVMFGMREV